MKSDQNALKQRGFLEAGAELGFRKLSLEKRFDLLNSPLAHERTLAARLLAGYKQESVVKRLIEALKTETKLYSKIAICESLVTQDTIAIKPLIDIVGKIKNNQYKSIPKKVFGKKNYPLAHDIAIRTLVRFGPKALPYLSDALETAERSIFSELLDAIGYICFYNPHPEVFEILKKHYPDYCDDDLVVWKFVRAMSAFPESKHFLEDICKTHSNPQIVSEAKRSLQLILN